MDIFIISSELKNERIQRMLMGIFPHKTFLKNQKIAMEVCLFSFFFFLDISHPFTKVVIFFASISMLWNVSIQLYLFEQVSERFSLVILVNLVLFFL